MEISINDHEIKTIAKNIFENMDDGYGQTLDQVERATVRWLENHIEEIIKEPAWWAFECQHTYNFDEYLRAIVNAEQKTLDYDQISDRQFYEFIEDQGPLPEPKRYAYTIGANGKITGATLKEAQA